MNVKISNEILSQSRWIPWVLVPSEGINKKAKKVPAVKWQEYKNRKPFHTINGNPGIIFDPSIDDLVGLDLDDCVDANGEFNELGTFAYNLFKDKAYIEISVSGNGLHFLFYASVGLSFNAKPIEYYEQGRYFTFSGNSINGSILTPLNCQTEIELFLRTKAPQQLANKTNQELLPEPSVMIFPNQARELLDSFNPDCDYNEWFQIACALHDAFEGNDIGFQLFHEWSIKGITKYTNEHDCRAKWDSLGSYKGNKVTINTLFAKANRIKAKTQATLLQIDFPRDAKGKIDPTIDNINLLLQAFSIRKDLFKDIHVGMFDNELRPMRETDFVRIQQQCEKLGFKRTIPKTTLMDIVSLYAENHSFDSGLDWGNSLEWDGVQRCKTILSTYFGAQNNEISQVIGLYMTATMAARLMSPGCQVDSYVVLYGSQGTGKTTSVKALAPPDSFGELSFKMKDEDKSRILKGRLILELSEMRGLQTSENEDIKSFMTRNIERFTDKFEKLPKEFPRRCIFIGTTNNQEFLNDSTGNRRWLPIEVKEANIQALKNDRNQIWAEAIQIYKTSNMLTLYNNAQNGIEEYRKNFVFSNPLAEEISNWFIDHPDVTLISNKELWESVTSYTYDQKSARILHHSMAYLGGWGKKIFRIGGKTFRGYEKLHFEV